MKFEIVYAAGAVLLLVALIWGANNYWRRRQGERKVGDATTERLYKHSGYPEA
jgi:hypothetical protein